MEHPFAPPLAPPKAVANRTFFWVFGENKKSRFSLKIRILHCFAFLCCGVTGNRTRDTRIFSPLLYQLSYDTSFVVWDCKGRYFFLTCKLFFNNFTKSRHFSFSGPGGDVLQIVFVSSQYDGDAEIHIGHSSAQA